MGKEHSVVLSVSAPKEVGISFSNSQILTCPLKMNLCFYSTRSRT